MITKPINNAIAAIVYIIVLVLIIQFGMVAPDKPDTILIPITMLCLFVLSASVMGYLFLAQPIQLYLDNKKKEAVNFFLQTVMYFATFTALVLIISVLVNLAV